jgi:hypothetical protein
MHKRDSCNILSEQSHGVQERIDPLYVHSYGRTVSVYERPSGRNRVREPRFDCTVEFYRSAQPGKEFVCELAMSPVNIRSYLTPSLYIDRRHVR